MYAAVTPWVWCLVRLWFDSTTLYEVCNTNLDSIKGQISAGTVGPGWQNARR